MKIGISALFGIMLLALIFAQPAVSMKPDIIGFRYGFTECTINTVIKLIEYVQDSTNVSGGSELITTLQGDLNTLKGYVDANDTQNFRQFLQGTVKNDVNKARIYLKDAKKELIKNRTDKDTILEYFKQVQKNRIACMDSATNGFVEKIRDGITARANNMGRIIENLKNKSIDTTEMESVYADAKEKINDLNNAMESGNATVIRAKIKELREEHLHIWARFHIARFTAILDAVTDKAIETGYQTDVDAINALLADAGSRVKLGEPYNPGEFEQVKNDLQQIRTKLRELIQKIKTPVG